ncbi:hypothetical protein M514_07538, partial [Trichuris suis]
GLNCRKGMFSFSNRKKPWTSRISGIVRKSRGASKLTYRGAQRRTAIQRYLHGRKDFDRHRLRANDLTKRGSAKL